MKICWIVSEDSPPGLLDPAVIKKTATSWGSWQRHQDYNLDNCICSNSRDSSTLIQHNFHRTCNLYIPRATFIAEGKPPGTRAFDGQFKNSKISNRDDIVAMNLAVPHSQLVLMYGFDFTIAEDRGEYYFNVREIIKTHSTTQFVLVDCPGDLPDWVSESDNITTDTIDNVIALLG